MQAGSCSGSASNNMLNRVVNNNTIVLRCLLCKIVFISVCPDNEIVVAYWDKVEYKHKRDQIKIMIVLVIV